LAYADLSGIDVPQNPRHAVGLAVQTGIPTAKHRKKVIENEAKICEEKERQQR